MTILPFKLYIYFPIINIIITTNSAAYHLQGADGATPEQAELKEKIKSLKVNSHIILILPIIYIYSVPLIIRPYVPPTSM